MNNSTQFQVFIPFAFEWLGNHYPDDPNGDGNPCDSTNLEAGQQRACAAVAHKHYLAQSFNNPDRYPARANFAQDMYAETDDGDKPYLVGVADPISVACDAKDVIATPAPSLGMSQRGANRWARRHQCSYTNCPCRPRQFGGHGLERSLDRC